VNFESYKLWFIVEYEILHVFDKEHTNYIDKVLVVEYKTTCVINANHYQCCEFESRSLRSKQHYVIKFVSDLRQVCGFPPLIKLTAMI